MAQLPNAHLAVVEERKLTAYLQSESHPVGHAKAVFFRGYGFRAGKWRDLRAALIAHARSGNVVSTEETKFGVKYIVEGLLMAADGRTVPLRTIWFIAPDWMFPIW